MLHTSMEILADKLELRSFQSISVLIDLQNLELRITMVLNGQSIDRFPVFSRRCEARSFRSALQADDPGIADLKPNIGSL